MRAIITGALGQDGTLLSQLLTSLDYEVVAVDQREGTLGAVRVRQCEVSNAGEISDLIGDVAPDEVYHLAAKHHSAEGKTDLATETQMVSTNFLATQHLVASLLRHAPTARLLIACSSQMYTPHRRADVVNETRTVEPATFYGLTKSWSWDLVRHARSQHGLHACAAILFNHESPLRTPDFVTRKITRAAARASTSRDPEPLALRDIQAETDWSSARDIVTGMQAILSAGRPDDYVLASGTLHSVAQLLDVAFRRVGLDWRHYVPRGTDVTQERPSLVGDPAKAKRQLGWSARIPFEQMIEEMVEHDLELLGATPVR